MKVKDAMHKGVQATAPATPLNEVAKMMAVYDIGALPVVENGRLLGMVTDRDITCKAVAADASSSGVAAKDIMSEPPVFCRETEEIGDAVHLMENRQVRRLPVLDKNDRLVGMLSLGDVAHATSQDMTGEMLKAVAAHHDEQELLSSAS